MCIYMYKYIHVFTHKHTHASFMQYTYESVEKERDMRSWPRVLFFGNGLQMFNSFKVLSGHPAPSFASRWVRVAYSFSTPPHPERFNICTGVLYTK